MINSILYLLSRTEPKTDTLELGRSSDGDWWQPGWATHKQVWSDFLPKNDGLSTQCPRFLPKVRPQFCQIREHTSFPQVIVQDRYLLHLQDCTMRLMLQWPGATKLRFFNIVSAVLWLLLHFFENWKNFNHIHIKIHISTITSKCSQLITPYTFCSKPQID